MLAVVTNQDFVACHKLGRTITPHIFRDALHFKAWARLRGPLHGQWWRPSHVQGGRTAPAVDHRHQIDPRVDDLTDQYQAKESEIMPTIDEMFPRDYLTGDDLLGRSLPVRIARVVQVETHPQPGTTKNSWVAYFEGKKKYLFLNKTIASQIAAATGSKNSDDWKGREITIYPQPMSVAGKPRTAIRVLTAEPAPDEPDDDEQTI